MIKKISFRVAENFREKKSVLLAALTPTARLGMRTGRSVDANKVVQSVFIL
jgi:hypothetical protein